MYAWAKRGAPSGAPPRIGIACSQAAFSFAFESACQGMQELLQPGPIAQALDQAVSPVSLRGPS